MADSAADPGALQRLAVDRDDRPATCERRVRRSHRLRRPAVSSEKLSQLSSPTSAATAIIGANRGEIAVVYNLDNKNAVSRQAARDLGWDGKSAVFQLDARIKRSLIEQAEQHADAVTAQ